MTTFSFYMERLFEILCLRGMIKNGPTKLIYVGIIRSQCQEGQNYGQSLGLLKVLLFKSVVKVVAWSIRIAWIYFLNISKEW